MDRDLQKLLKAIEKVIASDHRLRTGLYGQVKDRIRLPDSKVSVSEGVFQCAPENSEAMK